LLLLALAIAGAARSGNISEYVSLCDNWTFMARSVGNSSSGAFVVVVVVVVVVG
jgi:hypothetical protein